ncbi:MAG: hypothetical protein ABEH77_06875 [Halobacteriaceae archaeon]
MEIHLHDPEFTLFSRTGEDSGAGDDEREDDRDETAGGGNGALGALVALAVLVVVAFAVRRVVERDEPVGVGADDPDSGV